MQRKTDMFDMFNWLNKNFRRREYPKDERTDMEKIGDDFNKVIPFPELKMVPPMPEVKAPKEESGKTYYRLGLTDNNRVSFTMGYTEISMNREGVQMMIDQLEFYKSQLKEEVDD